MNIIVDAMGGDNAPEAIINGCIEAIREKEGFVVSLVGNENTIKTFLHNKNYDSSRIKIINAEEVITNEDTPTEAIKTKKNSSMVIGLKYVKENKGDVFLSAGNTGALMTGSLLILGRVKGVLRPALSSILPTNSGATLLIDVGANTVCKPTNLLQFGIMGSIYMKEMFNVINPKVGLINVGTEDKKGNETLKQAHVLLSQANINYVGNVEGREIPDGMIDVAVCDGFVGNVVLKFLEGVAMFIFDNIKKVYTKNIFTKLSALFVKREFGKFKKALDYTEYGGVPLLGVNGRVMKSHGSSNAKAIKNAVIKAYDYAKSTTMEQIIEEFSNVEVKENAN